MSRVASNDDDRGNGGVVTNRLEATGWRRLPQAFWLILVVAVGLRLFAVTLYGTHHPDEAFQYLEQAHRLVFDYGLVPWEFRYFIRSWLIPLMLSVPMVVFYEVSILIGWLLERRRSAAAA